MTWFGLPLSTALTSKPKADLAVLLSDRIDADLGAFGQYLPLEEFISVEIGDPAASPRGRLAPDPRARSAGPRARSAGRCGRSSGCWR
jgi:hypothetical protein